MVYLRLNFDVRSLHWLTPMGKIVLGVKENNHKFTPDGLSEELVAKYRKQFWDDARNKTCVNSPLLDESDIEEIKTDGGQYLLRDCRLILRIHCIKMIMERIFLS